MKVQRLAWVLVLGVIGISGCATVYKPYGLTGGYSDVQYDANTFRVEFRGNGYTPRETVEAYLLYRCAELTVQAGYDYFVMFDADTEALQRSVPLPGAYTATTTGYATSYGNRTYGSATTTGTYYPGVTMKETRYRRTTLVKAFKGLKPADHPDVYDAREVLHYLGRRVGR